MAKKCYNSVVIRALMALFLCVLLVSANQLQSFSTGEPPAGPGGSSGKTISGTVLAEDTNSPLNVNAYVYLEEDDHSRTTVLSQSVASDGQFTVSDIVYQDFILSFDPEMASDYLPKDFHVTVSGDTIEIDGQEYQQDNFTVTLNKTKVKGTVTKPDGTPLYDLSVKVYTDNNFNNQFNITGSNSGGGLYKLMTEGYGKLSYYVYDDSSELYGFSAITDVTINEDGSYSVNETPYSFGETQTLNLHLPALQFKGKIYDSDGTTIQTETYVTVKNALGEIVRKYKMIENDPHRGIFMIGGLPDGTYSLYAESTDQVMCSASKELTIEGSNITIDNQPYSSDNYIDLSLTQSNDPSLIRGFLINSITNEPIEGESLYLSVPDGCIATVKPNGEFRITGLTNGEHKIQISTGNSSDYLSDQVTVVVSGDTVMTNGKNYDRDNIAISVAKAKSKGTVKKPDGTIDYSMFIKVYAEKGNFNSYGSNSGSGKYKLRAEGSGNLSYYVYDEESELYGFSDRVDLIVNNDGSYIINNQTYLPGEVQVIDFVLPSLQFKGRVFDADDMELQTEAYIVIKNEANEIVKKYKMINREKQRGVFLIGGLPDGVYSLVAEIEEGASKRSSVPKEIKIQNTGITVDGAAYNPQNYIDLPLTERIINEGARMINLQFIGEDTLQPVEGSIDYSIFLIQQGNYKSISSGRLPSSGNLELVGLIGSEYRINISPEGIMDYNYQNLTVKVLENSFSLNNYVYDTDHLQILLGKTKARGTVFKPDGTIAENAFPIVYPSNDSPSQFSRYGSSSGDGSYKIVAEGYGKLSYFAFNQFSELFGFSDPVDVIVNEDGSFSIKDVSYSSGSTQTVNLNLPELQFKGKVFDSIGTNNESNSYIIVKNTAGEIIKKYRLFNRDSMNATFLIGGLPEGTYSLYAESVDRMFYSASKEVKIDGSTITVDNMPYNSGDYLSLSLNDHEPSLISGCLVDKETNQPIHENSLHISVPSGCISNVDNNGEFRIVGLTDGEHRIWFWPASNSDYLVKEVTLFVSGDSVTIDGQEYNRNNVVVRLGKTKVKGTVTNPDGNIASNVFIHAYSPDRSILYSSAAVNGKYKINSDVAGSLSYYAYDRSSESYGFSDRIDMTVNDDGSYQINGNPHPKGEVLAVNLELPALQFKGKVFDSSGTEVQTGHFVIVRNALGEIVRKYRLFELEFNHQGVFLIGGLPDGVYSLYAATEGWAVEWLSPSVEIRINGSSITADGVAYSSDQYINLLLTIPDAFCGITIDNVSGKVQGNTVEVKGTSTIEDLVVKVLRPDGSVYHEGSLISVNGKYSYTFTLASDAAIGEYKVFVGLGVNKAVRTFSVSRYTPPSDDSSGGGGGNATVPPTPTPTVTPTPTTAPVPTPVPMQTLTPEEQKQAGEEISKQLEEGTKNLVGNSAEETKGNLQNIAGSITSAIASTGQSTSQETQETIKKAVEDSINSIVNAVQTLADDDDLHSAGTSLNQIISDTAGLISDDLDSAGAQAVTESIGSVINGVRSVLGQMNDLNKAADLAKSIISSAGDVLGKVDGGAAEDKVAEQLKEIAKAVVDKASKQTVEAVKTGDTALATVQGDQLNDVIKQLETVKAVAEELQDSLKGSGIDEKIETKIAIDIQVGAEEKNVRAELPKELMEAVDKNGINKVEITAGDTKIDLYADFVENAGTQSLALEVRKEEANDELKSKMTEEQKKLLENNPTIFNFNAIVGGAQVTEFNKPVGIRIKYELKENENPDNITILYLADDGTIQNMTGKYDVETGEVVFSTNHFSKYIIKNLVLSFTDVPNDFWGISCIRSMASKGIIEGIGNGQFLPHDNVTRAEFAKMLTVAAGLVDKNATCEFTDVPKDKWYYKYIASAYASGLTSGIYYTEFGPEVKMTRQEMAAMIANAMQADITPEEALEIVGEYNDYELLADHLVKGMAIAVKTGIINGKPGKLLDPEGHATRAEAAAMIYRYFNH